MSVSGIRVKRSELEALLALLFVISAVPATQAQGVTPAQGGLAQTVANSNGGMPSLQAIVDQLKNQERELAEQKRQLHDQQRTIEQLKGQLVQATGPRTPSRVGPSRVASGRAVPDLSQANPQTPQSAQNEAPEPSPPGPPAPSTGIPSRDSPIGAEPGQPAQPVGEAPEKPEHAPEVAALVDVGGVLTPRGHLVIEPFSQYQHSSNSNFTFQGVQIIDALEIGLINAGQDKQDIISSGLTARYGLTNRLELEARIPYVYRDERLIGTLVNQFNMTSTQNAHGSGIGDIEGALHYQVNDGTGDWPFFTANLRFKSDSGNAPYNVNYSSAGFPLSLPTGSGFLALAPSVTVIYPSDPAVLYGNIGWIKNLGGTVTRQIGKNSIGWMAPGDTYVASFGMGLALNDRLSFTLGYENDYIQSSSQLVNGITQHTESLEVGELLFGMAFRVNNRVAANVQLGVGATRDAPDLQLTLRVPLSFEVCNGDSFLC